MIRPTALAITCMVLSGAPSPRSLQAQCLEIVDDPSAPSVPRPEVDVRQIIRLTAAGRTAIGTRIPYVVIVREASSEEVGGATVSWPRQMFVRQIDQGSLETAFTFSRHGTHTLELFAGATYGWPEPPTFERSAAGPATNRPDRVCDLVQTVHVDPAERRPDFPGVRPQWWVAFRLPLRAEAGTALFIQRLGFAASVENDLHKTIVNMTRDDGEPRKPNQTNATFEVRYRGSRGYLAGGVRYYPDEEPDRDHFRAGVFAGEELPTWKGRRLWLLIDVTLQNPQPNFFKGLRLSLAGRLDLWGSKP